MYVDRRLLRTKFLPLFMQRRWLESRYHVRSAYEIFKVLPPKKKNAAPQQAKNFVGVKRRQNDRVCCGAVRSFWVISAESGGYHSEHHHFCQQDLE